MNTYLITPGGSGTNFLYQTFGKENLTGGNDNFNPHQRYPLLHEECKLLYVFAHPANIILSFEKRGMLKDLSAVNNLQGDMNEARKIFPCTATEYFEHGKDIFGFHDHWNSWISTPFEFVYRSLFIKYKDIGNYSHILNEFMGMDKMNKWNFEPRQSDFREYPEIIETELFKKYEMFYNSRKDIEIR